MQLELKRIQKSTGTTFVYVTHDQEEALTMSDRIAVMDGGKSSSSSPTRETLYEQPRDRLRRRLHRHLERADGQRRPPRRRASPSSRSSATASSSPAECTVGDELEVTVRPEKISIGRRPRRPATARGIRGSRCVERVYLGSVSQTVVELPDRRAGSWSTSSTTTDAPRSSPATRSRSCWADAPQPRRRDGSRGGTVSPARARR